MLLPAPGLLRQFLMIPFLRRTFAALRVWLGMNDPSENHLHPSHGWLLPVPAVARVSARPDGGQPERLR